MINSFSYRFITALFILFVIYDIQAQQLIINKARVRPLLTDSNTIKHTVYRKPRLLLFYRNYITNQDGNGCQFTPTCSVYATRKIKEHGWLVGCLLALDRLNRCGHHLHLYTWNEQKQGYEDLR